jgi:phosphoribosylformylglycinamidine synthase
LVDVASIGHGKLSSLIANRVKKGDVIILAGNSTGKDGIHGASFASSNLDEEDRSAVQIPDPFLEKILQECIMESTEQKCIKAMKDLGGGGLSCCLSETADNLKKGFEIELSNVHLKQNDMTDTEIMISESQERMLIITSHQKKTKLFKIFDKYGIKHSVIGKVNNNGKLIIKKNGQVLAIMPAKLIAHAPLLDRPATKPAYLDNIDKLSKEPKYPENLEIVVFSMISNPNICSKNWVYQQFDHEVGIRTIAKPGHSDSSVLKLDNGKFITVKLDGNSKHCYLDPYQGTLGCLAESVRNTICVGASPIGVIDHLQFGNPENEQIFWTFTESIRAIRDFCSFMKIPVVGGKVSLYNESKNGSIKPSTVIGTVGLIENKRMIRLPVFEKNDTIYILGITKEELGGSEYFEYYHKIVGGKVPKVNLGSQKKTVDTIKRMVKNGLVSALHDCSKGGLIVSLLEISIQNNLGFVVDIDKIPTYCTRLDYTLFSESHDRFIFTSKHPKKVKDYLTKMMVPFAEIGFFTSEKICKLKSDDNTILNMQLSEVRDKYDNSLLNILDKKAQR